LTGYDEFWEEHEPDERASLAERPSEAWPEGQPLGLFAHPATALVLLGPSRLAGYSLRVLRALKMGGPWAAQIAGRMVRALLTLGEGGRERLARLLVTSRLDGAAADAVIGALWEGSRRVLSRWALARIEAGRDTPEVEAILRRVAAGPREDDRALLR